MRILARILAVRCGLQRVANLPTLQELSFLFLSVFKPACEELFEPSKGVQVLGGGATERLPSSVLGLGAFFLFVWLIGWLVCLKKNQPTFVYFEKRKKRNYREEVSVLGPFFLFTKVEETYE